jgi:hypothetical protein
MKDYAAKLKPIGSAAAKYAIIGVVAAGGILIAIVALNLAVQAAQTSKLTSGTNSANTN